MNIAIVEEQRLGGTCLNRGCIPAKELLQTAEVLRTVRGAAEFGVHSSSPTHRARRDAGAQAGGRRPARRRPRDAAEGAQGHDRRRARARSTPDGRTIRVSDGTDDPRPQRARSRPARRRARSRSPASSSTARACCRRTTCCSSTEVPARVAVIGGGAIGCEFASFLVDVGAEVTILEALPQMLAGVDQQVAQTVVRAFTKRGIKIADRRAGRSASTGIRRMRVRFEGKNGEETLLGRQGGRERRPAAALRGHRARRRGRQGRRARLRRRSTGTCARASTACTRSATSSPRRSSRTSRSRRRSSRSRRCSARSRCRSTTTRCRGASTAIPRSRSAGSPRRRRPSAATTSRRRCTAGWATAAR